MTLIEFLLHHRFEKVNLPAKFFRQNWNLSTTYEDLDLMKLVLHRSRLVDCIKYLNHNNFILLRVLRRLIHLILHLEINQRYFNKNLQLVHPYNVIIHPKTEIGKNVTIFNNVTLGSVDRGDQTNTPIIGNNVVIFPYSVIAGGISIGDNVIVQAGSIVLSSVPENSVVAGNPAAIVKTIKTDL